MTLLPAESLTGRTTVGTPHPSARRSRVAQQAYFYREQAAKMQAYAKTAPTAALRTMFEKIALEYEKLAAREAKFVR